MQVSTVFLPIPFILKFEVWIVVMDAANLNI